MNAAKAFKLNCRQAQLVDEHGASNSQTNDATSALRSGLSSSKTPVILTERIPTSLLPSAASAVQGRATAMASVLAAQHSQVLTADSGVTAKDAAATAGKGWFDMQKPVITKELAVDLKILQNRAALNPAAFYKKSAQRLPEYFQVGTVIQGATEFYSSRLSKQQRGRTFAEELLNDADVKFTLKKRFTKLQAETQKNGKKGLEKQLRKKKPLHKKHTLA